MQEETSCESSDLTETMATKIFNAIFRRKKKDRSAQQVVQKLVLSASHGQAQEACQTATTSQPLSASPATTPGCNQPHPLSREDTKLIYLTAEFQSLGDILKDHHLRKEEFMRLMMLLGYPGDRDDLQKLWKLSGVPDGGQMTLQRYIKLMSDEAISSKTDIWRRLFSQFDTDGNGFASKAEVVEGLRKNGVEITPEVRVNIESMDVNHDGKISYGEFLKVQLRQ